MPVTTITPRKAYGMLFKMLSLLVFLCCWSGKLPAQQYNANGAFSILEQGDVPNVCDQQQGANNTNFNAQCCGAPGERVCALVLHAGKGDLGGSAGCTNPGSNIIRYSLFDNNYYCQLPDAGQEQSAILPIGKPSTRVFKFLVTSDLHFYRITYNVEDQVNHPSRLNAMAASTYLSGVPYSAVIIPGDITTGGNEDRFGAYRTLWEQGNLPGASINLPVYFGLGNHDASARGDFGADSESDAQRIWQYLDQRFSGLTLDTSTTGCLVGVDANCQSHGYLSGSHNYSWDWEGIHLVMLNTWAGDTDRLYYPPWGMDGLSWLARDLAASGSNGKPVILFQHYPLNSIDDKDQSWTSDDYNRFQKVIAPYNIVGLFAGHTHQLSFTSKAGAVNQTSPGAGGPGTQLDNFVDGAGGDCSISGNGNGNNPCGEAKANFLSVQISDHYMDVTAFSWQGSGDTYQDSSIGMRNQGATCRKRLDATYLDLSKTTTSSINASSNTITVTNTSSTAIPGAVVIQLPSYSTSGDFVDSCDPNDGNNYLVLTENGLAANQSITVPFQPSSSLVPGSNPPIFGLSNTLVISNLAPVVGSSPVTLQLTSGSGNPVTFDYAPAIPTDGTTSWLNIRPNQYTTPATFTLTADNLPSYQDLTQSFFIFPKDPTIPSLTVTVSLAATFAATGNVPGITVTEASTNIPLPTTSTVSPNSSLNLNVVSPQYPKCPYAGAMYTFDHWSDGQGQQHSVTVPLGGVNLELFMNAFYLITPTINPPSSGTVSISTTSNGGYYPAGDTHLHASPAAGYYFAGYSGGLTSSSADADITLSNPLTFTATFAANPTILVNTDVPLGLGATVTVGSSSYADSVTQPLTPGTAVQIAVPNFVFPSGASGGTSRNPTSMRYAFVQWSDGNTNLSRSITGTTANVTLTAHYKVQYLVKLAASPADAGSVPNSTWYDSGSPATIQAVPNSGFAFTGFTGDVTTSTNPYTFTVQQSISITALFGPSGSPNIYAANAGPASDGVSAGQTVRMVPISLTNAGTGGAVSAQIDSISNIQVVSGSGAVSEAQPAATLFGDLAPSQSSTGTMLFSWPSSAIRVRMSVNFSANGGAYKHSTILTLFR